MADEFKVVYFKIVKEKTQQAYRRFRQRGREESFFEGCGDYRPGVVHGPARLGDPWFTYHELKLDVFVRAVKPLVVYYGVHQTEPVVFVHSLYVLEPDQE